MSVSDQKAMDERLNELDGTSDKSRLGANAMVAVSLACAHADAASQKIPLWKKLAGDRRVSLPVPQIQIFGGGAHARGSVDLQDYMIVCVGAGSFAEALEWTAQVYAAAGARRAAGRRRRGRLLAGVQVERGGPCRASRSNLRRGPRAGPGCLDRARRRGDPALSRRQLPLRPREPGALRRPAARHVAALDR